MSDLATRACTCFRHGNLHTMCATCRAWAALRETVEQAATRSRKRPAGTRGRVRRLEQRMRRLEDVLINRRVVEYHGHLGIV